jgi:hypothetical protein
MGQRAGAVWRRTHGRGDRLTGFADADCWRDGVEPWPLIVYRARRGAAVTPPAGLATAVDRNPHLAAFAGRYRNRCTQISGLPDSSDTYATQRVSGQNWP